MTRKLINGDLDFIQGQEEDQPHKMVFEGAVGDEIKLLYNPAPLEAGLFNIKIIMCGHPTALWAPGPQKAGLTKLHCTRGMSKFEASALLLKAVVPRAPHGTSAPCLRMFCSLRKFVSVQYHPTRAP